MAPFAVRDTVRSRCSAGSRHGRTRTCSRTRSRSTTTIWPSYCPSPRSVDRIRPRSVWIVSRQRPHLGRHPDSGRPSSTGRRTVVRPDLHGDQLDVVGAPQRLQRELQLRLVRRVVGDVQREVVRYPESDPRRFSQPLLCAVTSRKLAVVSPGHVALMTSSPQVLADQLRIADEVGRRPGTRSTARPGIRTAPSRRAPGSSRPAPGSSVQRWSSCAGRASPREPPRADACRKRSRSARRQAQRPGGPVIERIRRSGSAAGGTRVPCSPSSRPRPGRPSPSTPRACRRPPGCRARRCRRSAPPRCPAAAGWSPSG